MGGDSWPPEFEDVATAGRVQAPEQMEEEVVQRHELDLISQIVHGAVWSFPAAHGLWVVTNIGVALWSIAIFARYKDRYGDCDHDHLQVYFLVAGVVALTKLPFLWCTEVLRQNAEVAYLESLRRNVDPPPTGPGQRICGGIALFLQFFQVLWWLIGNVWVWRADENEAVCGDIASQGRELFVTEYLCTALQIVYVLYRVGEQQLGISVAHIANSFVSSAVAVLLAAVLADGTSVMKLSGDPPVALPTFGNATLRALLGWPYGLGPLYDSRGHNPSDGTFHYNIRPEELPQALHDFQRGHPAEILGCGQHKELLHLVTVLGFVGCAISIVLVAVNVFGMELAASEAQAAFRRVGNRVGFFSCHRGSTVRLVCWLSQAALGAAFVLALAAAGAIYDRTYDCDNLLIPRLRLGDHFDIGYAIPVLAAAAGSTLLAQALFIVEKKTDVAQGSLYARHHGTGAVLTTLLLCLLSSCVADGSSVAQLKTNSSVASFTIGSSVQVFGHHYGIGVLHDSRGWRWTQGGSVDATATTADQIKAVHTGNAFEVLGCGSAVDRGEVATVLVLCGVCLAVLELFAHMAGRTGLFPDRLFRIICLALAALTAIALLCGMSFLASLYNGDFSCSSSVVAGGSLKVSDHFDFSYGLFFLGGATLLAVSNVVVCLV